MKVLYLANEFREELRPLAGIYVRDQALTVLSAGHSEVAVCYVEPRSLRTFGLRGLREHHFQVEQENDEGILVLRQRAWNPASATLTGGRMLARWTAALASRYIREFGPPQLIHAHNVMWAGYAAQRVARKHRLPYVVTEHSSVVLSRQVPLAAVPELRAALLGASRVLAVSSAMAAAVSELSGVTSEVVPNPLDTDFFRPPQMEPPTRAVRFLAVGNLYPVKGFDLLLDAFAHRFRGREAELEIIGDGPERGALCRRAETLGIQWQVRWSGQVNREGVREAMWRAHALVVSSRRETFSLVSAEALATGLPVLATRCGGPEDILTAGAGLLVERDNVEQLSEGMEKILLVPTSRAARRETIVRRYGRKAVGERLQQIYDETAGRARNLACV